jgi:hypothetical protein
MTLFAALVSFLVGEVLLFLIYGLTLKIPEYVSLPEDERLKKKKIVIKLLIQCSFIFFFLLVFAVWITQG